MEKDIVRGLEKSMLLRCQFAKLSPYVQCSPNQIPAGCFGRNRPQLILKFLWECRDLGELEQFGKEQVTGLLRAGKTLGCALIRHAAGETAHSAGQRRFRNNPRVESRLIVVWGDTVFQWDSLFSQWCRNNGCLYATCRDLVPYTELDSVVLRPKCRNRNFWKLWQSS